MGAAGAVMEINNTSIAEALKEIARELTEGVEPTTSLPRCLALGMAVGAITRTAQRLLHPDAPQFREEIPELYDVARDACHAVGVSWVDPRTGIRYPPPSKRPH